MKSLDKYGISIRKFQNFSPLTYGVYVDGNIVVCTDDKKNAYFQARKLRDWARRITS